MGVYTEVSHTPDNLLRGYIVYFTIHPCNNLTYTLLIVSLYQWILLIHGGVGSIVHPFSLASVDNAIVNKSNAFFCLLFEPK